MRLFIAFPVSPEVINELMRVQRELVNLNSGLLVKWTEPQNFHVTAEFLGELNEADANVVKTVLKKAVFNHRSFTYQLDGTDAFPDVRRPSVLIVRSMENGREGFALRQKIHSELHKMNLAEDNKLWQPHITLGRVKNELRQPIVDLNMQINPITWTVSEVYLIKSDLTPRGSKYSILEKFFLK